MKYNTIGIAGAGTMGASMAECFASYGYTVKLFDIFEPSLEKAKRLIAINQETEIACGHITAGESTAMTGRIEYSSDINILAGAQFLIEAVKEDINVKLDFWAKASALVSDDAVLASNTSGLSITAISRAVRLPHRFGGMHWINPPHIIPLIEVIKGEDTSDAAAQAIYDLSEAVGKQPVIVRDAPGFVLNRIQLAILRECLHIAEQGIASERDIDRVMQFGLGPRYACMGPFAVSDLGGLDIFNSIASYLFSDLSDEKSSFGGLKRHFEAGEYGVKNGKGFFDYSGDKAEEAIRYRDAALTKIIKALYGGGE